MSRRARGAAPALAALAVAAAAVAGPSRGRAQDATAPGAALELAGTSVRGRPIALVRVGDLGARRRVLVVGAVHGDEGAGRAIADELLRRGRAGAVPAGVELLLVRDANPDGHARGTRQNAHGVDLNRNSSQAWRPMPGPTASGRRPWSEPETRALRGLVRRERPRLVVWYHQPLALVDAPESGRATAARRYAGLTGLPFRPLPHYPGSLSRWVNARMRPGSSFVVELPPGRPPARTVARHARAVLRLAATAR
jgi:protein MpaA